MSQEIGESWERGSFPTITTFQWISNFQIRPEIDVNTSLPHSPNEVTPPTRQLSARPFPGASRRPKRPNRTSSMEDPRPRRLLFEDYRNRVIEENDTRRATIDEFVIDDSLIDAWNLRLRHQQLFSPLRRVSWMNGFNATSTTSCVISTNHSHSWQMSFIHNFVRDIR
jgi:hypothetical protein